MKPFLALSAALASASAPALTYKVYDLGVWPGFFNHNGTSYAVNDAGTVVGYANAIIGFQWDFAHGLRPVVPVPSFSGSEAFAVSPSGLIAGSFRNLFNGRTSGYVHRPDGRVVIIYPLFQSWLVPSGVNDSMQVVGDYYRPSHTEGAFLWTPQDGLRDLGALKPGGQATANAINASGTVVGTSDGTDGFVKGFRWTEQTGMVRIDPWPGFSSSWCSDVNELGDAVLQDTQIFEETHSHVSMADGSVREIRPVTPGLGIKAWCINDHGDVAGLAHIGQSQYRAFVSPFGEASVLVQDHLDAASQGWILLSTLGMNNEGWLVGVGNHGGENHPYLAVPVSNPPKRG